MYLASRKNDQKQVPFRLYLWWVLALPACMSITSLIGTNRDTFSVVYELRAGMYKIFHRRQRRLGADPALFVLSLVINLAAFAVGNWPWDNFITFVVTFAITLWVYDSFAQLMAVSFKSPVIGMLGFLGYWSSSIVFCGLVFRATDVVVFRLFYYVLPLKWTFNASGYDVYMPTASFKGAALCDAGADALTLAWAPGLPAGGFYCDGAATSFGCWGATGEQVLNTEPVVREPRHGRRPRVRYRHPAAHGLRPEACVRRHAVARRLRLRRAEENQKVNPTPLRSREEGIVRETRREKKNRRSRHRCIGARRPLVAKNRTATSTA